MRKFDTKVQLIKYKVLKEVAKAHWNDNLTEAILDIPEIIVPGKEATMRCCVYKERAIINERIKIAISSDENAHTINVIDIACDECPIGGYVVSDACRGCLSHRCESACKFNAITFDNHQKAHIDKSKCKECGACAKVCPYSAINNYKRPCESACKVKAISRGDDNVAKINYERCISCGACVYQCPFGAITDKSFILNAIDIIKESKNNSEFKVYAVVAPTISTQFNYAKLGQVVTALKNLGFYNVIEAALGADMVASQEATELAEKGFLTSSCCPAFVSYVKKNFPNFIENVSTNLSPMATIAKYIKDNNPTAKIIFIGPCTAKKDEFRKPEVKPFVDCVITFEELQALFDSKEIDLQTLDESELEDASYFGRIFARCGGLSDAVKQALKEQGYTDFDLKPCSCNGIEEIKVALLRKSKNILDANFIEGMACLGGCIGGAGCLTHGDSNVIKVNKHGETAKRKSIKEAISSSRTTLDK